MEERKHIVIVAAGDFPTHPEPLRALRGADFVVCCDSAYATLRHSALGDRDCMVIGDGDSMSDADKRALGKRWLQVDEQDYNDLHKAMCWATATFGLHGTAYTIVGATGRREDHTLGNIAYLATFAGEYPGIALEMITDYGRFRYVEGAHTFRSFARQQVSLFTLSPATAVTATGLRWPLAGAHFERWWQGTLNEALADTFSVEAAGIVVYQTHEAKQ